MKKFQFSLEKTLRFRKFNEQEAKNEMGRAIGVLTGLENDIKQNDSLLKDASVRRFQDIQGSTSADNALSMLAWNAYCGRLEQNAERLTEEAVKAETIVEEKRSIYLETSKELKIMEKLKEKRAFEYRKEVLAYETLQADDQWRGNSAEA